MMSCAFNLCSGVRDPFWTHKLEPSGPAETCVHINCRGQCPNVQHASASTLVDLFLQVQLNKHVFVRHAGCSCLMLSPS